MVMLAEHYDFVIGGDPDRDTIDLAILEASPAGSTTRPLTVQTVRLTTDCWLGASACSRAPRLGVGGHRQLRRRLSHDPG